MKCRKLLIGLIALLPLTFESCSNVVTYERAREWVSTNYMEEESLPWPAIATFTWDYHGTVGDKAMDVISKLMGTKGEDGELVKIIPEFEKVVYFPGSDKDKLIGKKIIVYHHLEIPPLNIDDWDTDFHYNEKDSYKINNKELTITTSYDLPIDGYPEPLKCTIIHVHNKYGFYRGIGFKIGYGYMDSENIVKLKVITEFTYEDS